MQVERGALPSIRYDLDRIQFARELMNRGFTDEQIVRAVIYEFPQTKGRLQDIRRTCRSFVKNLHEDERWQSYVDTIAVEKALAGNAEAWLGLTHEERFMALDRLADASDERDSKDPDWLSEWCDAVGVKATTMSSRIYKRKQRREQARSGIGT